MTAKTCSVHQLSDAATTDVSSAPTPRSIEVVSVGSASHLTGAQPSHDGDIENQVIGAPGGASAHANKRHRRVCCGACLAATLALSAALAVFLWPKAPTWSVRTINIEREVVQGFVAVFMDPKFNSTKSFPVEVTVGMHNTNYAGAIADRGSFVVTHDSHVLAVAQTEPMDLKGRSDAVGVAHAQATITPELSKILMKAVVPTYRLVVQVAGGVSAKLPALLGLAVHVRVQCTVEVNVLALVQNPNLLVVGHECSYTGSL